MRKKLVEIVNMCILAQKKLLFIFIYNRNHKKTGIYDKSEMYRLYMDFVEKYRISVIDVFNLLHSKCGNNWINYYQDQTHLSPKGMAILTDKILEEISNVNTPKIIGDNSYLGFNKIRIARIKDCLDTYNYSNSLVNVNYFTSTDKMIFKFDRETTILAIEYICDKDSGYIELSNGKSVIHKNTLKKEDFVLEKGKKMASIITFNKLLLENGQILTISNINYNDVKESIYDKEKITLERKNENPTTFKIVSLLLTNGATIGTVSVD